MTRKIRWSSAPKVCIETTMHMQTSSLIQTSGFDTPSAVALGYSTTEDE
jgi:hypothetical protein